MSRVLALAFLAGAADVGVVVGLREPTDTAALTALLFGIGLVTFSVVTAALYYRPRPLRRRPRAGPALRRGALAGLAVASLAFLRAVDALTAVTLVFVLAAFAALEGLLSARG